MRDERPKADVLPKELTVITRLPRLLSTITIPTGFNLALYSKSSRKKQFANQCTGIPRRTFLITCSGLLTVLDDTVFISFIPASSLCGCVPTLLSTVVLSVCLSGSDRHHQESIRQVIHRVGIPYRRPHLPLEAATEQRLSLLLRRPRLLLAIDPLPRGMMCRLPLCPVCLSDLPYEHVEHGVPRLFLVLELLHHLRALFYPHLLVRRLVHVEL